jgi:site-specific DNA recombinase
LWFEKFLRQNLKLENFTDKINFGLDRLDWNGKRDIIRQIVKRIEIGDEEINIVYKINKLLGSETNANVSVQHCCNGIYRLNGAQVL